MQVATRTSSAETGVGAPGAPIDASSYCSSSVVIFFEVMYGQYVGQYVIAGVVEAVWQSEGFRGVAKIRRVLRLSTSRSHVLTT
jgi:hypothetical protein